MTNQFHNILTGETVTPESWQLELKIGDYYTIQQPILAYEGQPVAAPPPVYGKIISDEDCQQGHFWVEAYSQWCPEGETGLMCICDPTKKLTEEQFNNAKKSDWLRYVSALVDPPDATLALISFAIDGDEIRANVRKTCEMIGWNPDDHYEGFYEGIGETTRLDNGDVAHVDLWDSDLMAGLIVGREDHIETYREKFKEAFNE